MKRLVIYDDTGTILTVIYGMQNPPDRVHCLTTDDEEPIESIDVIDPGNPIPIYRKSEQKIDTLDVIEQAVNLSAEIERLKITNKLI